MISSTIDAVRGTESVDTVRAWWDTDYRGSLTEEQLAALPESPVGDLEAIDPLGPMADCSWCISALGLTVCLTTGACTNPCCAW
jgi:mersacidin/lichenicidin family type 2 lantibiotic